MLDTALLSSVASQMTANSKAIKMDGKSVSIRRTSGHHLKRVTFNMGGRKYTALEQNPEKPTQWGKLARAGHQVVQFKDVKTNKFVAVAVDGDVKVYQGIGK
jgi:alkylated DNA repair dioxygenase AlkB